MYVFMCVMLRLLCVRVTCSLVCMDDIKFKGWPAVFLWTVVAIVLMCVIRVWFGALVWCLCMRHVLDAWPSRSAPVAPSSAPSARVQGKRMSGLLCEDCVFTHAVGEPKNKARLHTCMSAHDELVSNWPTWVEDMGPDSLIAESVKPCKCCGTQAKGARVLFHFE